MHAVRLYPKQKKRVDDQLRVLKYPLPPRMSFNDDSVYGPSAFALHRSNSHHQSTKPEQHTIRIQQAFNQPTPQTSEHSHQTPTLPQNHNRRSRHKLSQPDILAHREESSFDLRSSETTLLRVPTYNNPQQRQQVHAEALVQYQPIPTGDSFSNEPMLRTAKFDVELLPTDRASTLRALAIPKNSSAILKPSQPTTVNTFPQLKQKIPSQSHESILHKKSHSEYLLKKRSLNDVLPAHITEDTDPAKLRKVDLVGKLLGNCQGSSELLRQYNHMIRVMPEQFDIKKLQMLRKHMRNILEKPDDVYKYQATVNPKHQFKMMHLENVISVANKDDPDFNMLALPPVPEQLAITDAQHHQRSQSVEQKPLRPQYKLKMQHHQNVDHEVTNRYVDSRLSRFIGTEGRFMQRTLLSVSQIDGRQELMDSIMQERIKEANNSKDASRRTSMVRLLSQKSTDFRTLQPATLSKGEITRIQKRDTDFLLQKYSTVSHEKRQSLKVPQFRALMENFSASQQKALKPTKRELPEHQHHYVPPKVATKMNSTKSKWTSTNRLGQKVSDRGDHSLPPNLGKLPKTNSSSFFPKLKKKVEKPGLAKLITDQQKQSMNNTTNTWTAIAPLTIVPLKEKQAARVATEREGKTKKQSEVQNLPARRRNSPQNQSGDTLNMGQQGRRHETQSSFNKSSNILDQTFFNVEINMR